MAWSFTPYLALLLQLGLALDSDDELLRQLTDDVLRDLRRALRTQLRRRGLLHLSPTLVGYVGDHWGGDAMTELVHDTFREVFDVRMGSLVSQYHAKGNIDGIVLLIVSQTVSDKQRHADPIGHTVWSVVREGIEELIEEGRLLPVGAERSSRTGRWQLGNQTVLSFGDDHHDSADDQRDRLKFGLATQVEGWVPELIPDIISGRGAAGRRVVDLLKRRVSDLGANGTVDFRLGSILGPLVRAVRPAWVAFNLAHSEETSYDEETEGKGLRWLRTEVVGLRHERSQLFARVSDCVRRGIVRWGDDLAVDLLTVWDAVVLHATTEDEHQPLSLRELGRRTGIERRRLPAMLNRLAVALRACRSNLGGDER